MTLFSSIQAQFADKNASADAINLARRMTRSNEPDLLQESFMADALKVQHASDYPHQCHEYEDTMILLRRHNFKDAYAGMSPGDRADAMRAKDEGHLNAAQIKRRMTTRNKGRWF